MRSSLLVGVTLLLLAGCGIPRDPEGTLERVREGTLRAGMTLNEPWVRPTGDGIEQRLIEEFADRLGARVEWREDSESDLFTALERGELDLVVAGLTADTPWTEKAAITRPYHEDRVMAVRAGENGFQTALERFLFEQEGLVEDLMSEIGP